MTLPVGAYDKVKIYVGSDVIGSASMEWYDISTYVQPGWRISRDEGKDALFRFELSNPEGKFTDSTFEDYVEIIEDYPILLLYDYGNVYFYGIISSPPLKDDMTGSNVTIDAVSRMAVLRKEDVVARFLTTEYHTVEDVIYAIIYDHTALNSYYGITYDKPDCHTRHKLLRDFIFNNKDAHTCLTEILDYHKLFLMMDVDEDGNDTITISRLEKKNVGLALSTTLSTDNIIDITRERGSEIFYNKVKIVGRDENGNVLIAEQQDVESIQSEGLRVRPTEDIGNVQNQNDVQSYAEYAIAKCSRDNYTTTIRLDPTKFNEEELWNLHPLDIVKVIHPKTGLGTNEKYHVESVELSGNTFQLTGVTLILNHSWRSAMVMMFEEFVPVYDEDSTIEDEQLVESRIMTAYCDVDGWWNFVVNVTDNKYPSDEADTGGFHGMTDMGKMLVKANWVKDPKYGTCGVPTDYLSMRPSMIWPLKADGTVYGPGYWTEHADGWDNDEVHGTIHSGADYYYQLLCEYNITPSETFNVYGALVCSRYGGRIERVDGTYGTFTNKYYLDDVSYLVEGMTIVFARNNEGGVPTSTTSLGITVTITGIDYDNNYITFSPNITTSAFSAEDYWYANCFPIARFLRTTAVSFTSGVHCYLRWHLRFTNDNDTYGTSNLSVVTKDGLKSLVMRLRYDYFQENPNSTTALYPRPVYMALGLNDSGTPRTAVDDDNTLLNNEISRSGDSYATVNDVTTVSESAKCTARFDSLEIPPKVVNTALSAAASINDTIIYVDSTEGFVPGDPIFFGTSGGGGYTFTEDSLAPNFVQELRGYSTGNSGYGMVLRHAIKVAKSIDTSVTTGKLKERKMASIKEIGLFDGEATEHTDTFSYLGERTGTTEDDAKTVETDENVTNSGMGFGDYQYDELQDEDSLKKIDDGFPPTYDHPPSFFSGQATSTFNYLKTVRGYGQTTIPLIRIVSGPLKQQITFDVDDFYGKQNPLSTLLEAFTDDTKTNAARSISPLQDSSYAKEEHINPKICLGYRPSKWRPFAGIYSKTKQKGDFWHSDPVNVCLPYYASQIFTFAVSDDITRRDLKNLSVVWRGTAKSWDTTNTKYTDGVEFFIWHFGDKQPEYVTNDDGSKTLVGPVGNVKTFDAHWERLEMVDIDGVDVNIEVPTNPGYNSLRTETVAFSGGEDNTVGINLAGYCLSDDNKIYIIAITTNAGSFDDEKMSSITTDFIGLTVGSGNILNAEQMDFERGVDFLYDPSWNFIAWPPLDFEWNGTSYNSMYCLEEVGALTASITPPTCFVYLGDTTSKIFAGDILLISSSTASELVSVKYNLFDSNVITTTSTLKTSFSIGSKVYKYVRNNNRMVLNLLKKKITPNFPSKNFVNTSLATASGRMTYLTEDLNPGNKTAYVSISAGFNTGKTIMFYRRPDKSDQLQTAYEWTTISDDPTTDTLISFTDGIRRVKCDDNDVSYDDGASDDKVEVGIVKFECPSFDSGMAMSWSIDGGLWKEGDALGTKWVAKNNKWGLHQYPFLNCTITQADGTILTSNNTPGATVGSGFSGWEVYGGPGVKVEYYNRDDGEVTVTKALDISLRNGTSSGDDYIDTQAEIEANTFYAFDVGTYINSSGLGQLAFYAYGSPTVDVAEGFDSNGNRSPASTYYHPLKIARNSYIKIKDIQNTSCFVQLSIAEAISDTGDNWKLIPKYRMVNPGSIYKTCYRPTSNNPNYYFYLDAPFFEHPNDGSYTYHDNNRGNVVFILDIVGFAANECLTTTTPAISVGATSITSAAVAGSSVIGDSLVFESAAQDKNEMVQITNIVGNVITFTPATLNSYVNATDTIYYRFVLNATVKSRHARLPIIATQVYQPMDDGDKLNISAFVYRAAKYDLVYAEETGKLLVYSLLKDGTVYRPIETDRSDAVQVIQEVKFNYLEKDMV